MSVGWMWFWVCVFAGLGTYLLAGVARYLCNEWDNLRRGR